jgi:RHS repeat-associated protein
VSRCAFNCLASLISYTINRLIDKKKNNSVVASFTYDGDGNRLKSVMGTETTLFIGGHYEVTNPGSGQTVTKYYFAGAQRVAMKKTVIPQSETLTYLLGDHLGSTSLAVTGNEIIETRYKPWGEVRYTTPNKTLPTRYTYTGQYSYVNDDATDLGSAGFGLMFYNSRWYDPAIGRFAQADTIVPDGVQGLDRYAYVNNNPLALVDPSGHFSVKAIRDYLLDYYEGNRKDAVAAMKEWRNDKDWWAMIGTAKAGDNLFGTSSCCHIGNSMPSQFTASFVGSGNDYLAGIEGSLSDTTSLSEIQQGIEVTGTSTNGEGVTFGQTFKWIGFYRQDHGGKPSFYIRPGYEMVQKTTSNGVRTGLTIVSGFGIGIPVTMLTGGWGKLAQVTLGGLTGSTASTIGTNALTDALDMEEKDVNVYIGPVYFNFQQSFPSGDWIREK